jgi:hypothetical protein
MRYPILLLAAILILSACAVPQDPLPGSIEQPELSAPAPASPTPPESTPAPAEGPADPAAESLVELARGQLAEELGIDRQEVSLFNVQAVNWPDEALGCPQGAQNYAQVITPGYLIQLEAGGSLYSFHSDTNARVVLCQDAGPGDLYLPPL